MDEALDEPLPLHCLRALEQFLHRADCHRSSNRVAWSMRRYGACCCDLRVWPPLACARWSTIRSLWNCLLTGWDERVCDATLRRVSETAALAAYTHRRVDVGAVL
jgi:hypothetical protein